MHKETARFGASLVMAAAMMMACVVVLILSSSSKDGYISRMQSGSVTVSSKVSGTSDGTADIFFGGSHLDGKNVAESYLLDDQVSAMNAGGNGPVTRNEGMYNSYVAMHSFWADTTNMDNLRGADSSKATPGSPETVATDSTISGFGNTVHTYSGDDSNTWSACAIPLSCVAGRWSLSGIQFDLSNSGELMAVGTGRAMKLSLKSCGVWDIQVPTPNGPMRGPAFACTNCNTCSIAGMALTKQ